VTGC